MSERFENIGRRFETIVATLPEYQISGRLQRAAGMLLEASGLELPVGARCELQLPEGTVPAEVTGFNGDRSFLMPLARLHGAFPGARVVAAGELRFPPCMDLLGRVINALGEPLDGRPLGRRTHTLQPGEPINPLHRRVIDESLDVGIRSINGLLRVGVGQRLGLFAGSGVGKSVLLGMLARFTAADVVVVGLIGERGREVSEFVADNLGAGLARAVVVAAPADDSPALRLRGALLATQLAEQFSTLR